MRPEVRLAFAELGCNSERETWGKLSLPKRGSPHIPNRAALAPLSGRHAHLLNRLQDKNNTLRSPICPDTLDAFFTLSNNY